MSFISADQLLAHAMGDYVLQSHWMAVKKTTNGVPAMVHALIYSLVFAVAFRPSWVAWAVIYSTHYVIDRYRLARFVVTAKNSLLSPPHEPGLYLTPTGSPGDTAPFLAVWLLIIVDNVLHVAINGAALRWL